MADPVAARRLAGADLVLAPPASLAARWDVVLASVIEGAEHRARAAALGLCWPRYHRRRPYGGSALRYGGDVIDTLMSEGASYGDIQRAGIEALGLCLEGLPPVEGAEVFSAPPAVQDGTASGG